MRRRVLPAALAALILARMGASASEALSDAELQAELSGNTLSGYNTSGVIFSEYHAPDGRILGHNNGEPVLEGCWQVRQSAVCYYYARSTRPGTYCWSYARAGQQGYRITSLETEARGIVRREAGNPRGHSDGGKSWTCEGLVSGLDRRAARMAKAAPNVPPLTSP